MDNRYHPLLETPEANRSRAMQRLNAGWCSWFGRRHRRLGLLLQGRFGAFLVETDADWREVARYAGLNPVWVAGVAEAIIRRSSKKSFYKWLTRRHL